VVSDAEGCEEEIHLEEKGQNGAPIGPLSIHLFLVHSLYTIMKTIIKFNILQDDGIYTADGANVPIVTEGGTFEELQENIRDAVALYFEGDDPVSLGFAKMPSILTNFDVSPPLYAGRA
jgi:predicted RNase H-like HicB family nuclease